MPQTGVLIWRKQEILDVGGWKHDEPSCQEHDGPSKSVLDETRAKSPLGRPLHLQEGCIY